jgi:hypothetical protein
VLHAAIKWRRRWLCALFLPSVSCPVSFTVVCPLVLSVLHATIKWRRRWLCCAFLAVCFVSCELHSRVSSCVVGAARVHQVASKVVVLSPIFLAVCFVCCELHRRVSSCLVSAARGHQEGGCAVLFLPSASCELHCRVSSCVVGMAWSLVSSLNAGG